MMISDMTHEWLIDNGFIEYDITEFDSAAVDHFYQKCYKDDFGKKYYLEVKHYVLFHPYTGEDLSGYEVSGQFYLKNSHNAVNMSFLNSHVNEVEDFIEKLFDNNMLDYYEV